MRRRTFLELIVGTSLVAGGASGATDTGFIGRFIWRGPERWFGGFSAIHLYPDGLTALVLNDRGRLLSVRLRRDAAGRIDAAEILRAYALRGPDGAALRPHMNDSEGIAVGADGRIFVSFEGLGGGRVWVYDHPAASARIIPQHPAFRRTEMNKALEALAIDRDGALYTLPEDLPGRLFFPLFRFDARGWQIVAEIPRDGGFLPVAADFGPDGRFYLLERRVRLPVGMSTRIRRFAPDDWTRGDVILQTRIGTHDNLEGLSVTHDRHGQLRATMVSDDNFLFVQRTEIVEYLLPA